MSFSLRMDTNRSVRADIPLPQSEIKAIHRGYRTSIGDESVLVFDNDDVEDVLPMELVVKKMEATYRDLGNDEAINAL